MDERAKHDIYIALNKKEILQYATTCMNLKDIMLNEVSYSQKVEWELSGAGGKYGKL